MSKAKAALLVVVVAGLALLLSGSTSAPEGITVAQGSNGELMATLHTEEANIVLDTNMEPGCFFTPKGPAKPCFVFEGTNGTESVHASGCVPEENHGAGVMCPVAGVKSVKIVVENGGVANINGGNGDHGHGCAPVPVTLELHGGSGGTFNGSVWDGCAETVSCADGFGAVDADKNDTVKPNCESVTRH